MLPEMCHYLLAQLSLARGLVASVEVDVEAMEANLASMGDFGSQELLRRLSVRLGKHRANDELQEAYRLARTTGRPLSEVLAAIATPAELDGLDRPCAGAAGAMVDAVAARAAQRRASESDDWV